MERRAPTTSFWRAGWYLMTFLALAVGIRASQYVSLNPLLFEAELRERYLEYLSVVVVHAASSIAALMIGPLSLHGPLRAFSLPLHRILGRFYFACVFFGAITGAYMACHADGGPIARTGLFLLAVCWIVTAYLGLYYAVRRKPAIHRRWMFTNYSLTFAAVTLRLEVTALTAVGFDYTTAYRIAAWSSWLLNLAGAEFLLRKRMRNCG